MERISGTKSKSQGLVKGGAVFKKSLVVRMVYGFKTTKRKSKPNVDEKNSNLNYTIIPKYLTHQIDPNLTNFYAVEMVWGKASAGKGNQKS